MYIQYASAHTHTQQTQAIYTGFPVMWRALEPDTLMRAGRVLTAGWSLPRVFSLMASASLRRFAASLYLFWSLKSRKHIQINLLQFVEQQRAVAKVFQKKSCFHGDRVMAQQPNVPNALQTGYYHSLQQKL